MSDVDLKKKLVEELASLDREALNERAKKLELTVKDTWKDDTLRKKIVEKVFPSDSKGVSDLVLVKITGPVAGKFKLPYNIDQEVGLPENLAKELVETKYAEYVK